MQPSMHRFMHLLIYPLANLLFVLPAISPKPRSGRNKILENDLARTLSHTQSLPPSGEGAFPELPVEFSPSCFKQSTADRNLP